MALYARLDRAAVEGLARQFGIDDIVAFSVMDGGLENTNYCLETNSEKYILTLFDQKSLKHATDLASLLLYLTDHGIRTSRVVVPSQCRLVIRED
jgi:homoserine kinase type II